MPPPGPFVSRGGLKIQAAIDAFALDLAGAVCADLGCNVGGFTDCMLQRGASRVFAVDTGYGGLAWKLRQDPRVTVLERTNALHFDPQSAPDFSGCDLVSLDLGWTRQALALPAAMRWLKKGGTTISGAPHASGAAPISAGASEILEDVAAAGGRWPARRPAKDGPLVISLIKPHYEAEKSRLHRGVLDPADALTLTQRILTEMPRLGLRVLGCVRSPILGGGDKGKGNVEYLALLEPDAGA
ncbi:MAG: TlyA family rRNA (cytidine-2'-O)-methyltransferase [Planctomycetota bacterium]|nr:TlyA family rRNA (cytidine-2'-O)-methyltransferase [Planctomycetota bacterium]